MEFHVTDVDSQTTYVSDLSPSDVWRRVSSSLKGNNRSGASVLAVFLMMITHTSNICHAAAQIHLLGSHNLILPPSITFQ
jgi:hypothetical protein